MIASKKSGLSFAEILLYFFILSLFLLSSDPNPEFWPLRLSLGLIAAFLGGAAGGMTPWLRLRNISTLIFFIFLGYEILRAFKAPHLPAAHPEDSAVILQQYREAPWNWVLFAGLYAAGYAFFDAKSKVSRLFVVLVVLGSLLAFNTLPILLSSGQTFHSLKNGEPAFFYPFLYAHPLLKRYVTGQVVNENLMGDFIGLGLFPALAVLTYTFQLLWDEWKKIMPEEERGGMKRVSNFFLQFVLAGAMGVTILMIKSRGTIMALLPALVIFFILIALKYARKGHGLAVLVIAGMLAGFLYWGTNMRSVIKEMETLKQEERHDHTSLAFNHEAWTASLRIHKAYPLWGVGTAAYPSLVQRYVTPGRENLISTRTQAMSHYLQILAEEGKIGGVLYFLFLIAYGAEMAWGLWETRSRFKFLAGLGLFCGVLLIFTHAAFNHILERNGVSAMVYLCMGTGLGVLRPDFSNKD